MISKLVPQNSKPVKGITGGALLLGRIFNSDLSKQSCVLLVFVALCSGPVEVTRAVEEKYDFLHYNACYAD